MEDNKKKRIYPEKLATDALDGVAELEKLCFSQPWSAKSLELLTKEGIGTGVVCRCDGIVCAYGGMLVAVDEGQITNVATDPDFRRRGFAAAVIGELLAVAQSRGLREVTLEVRESNAAAIALYRRFGFESVGRRPNFYTHPVEAALVMQKMLSAEK